MSFAGLVKQMDDTCLSSFGLSQEGIVVLFTPQGGVPQQIDGIIENPAMAEDFVPDSLQGTGVVRLFIRFVDITPFPQKGDSISINGVSYEVQDDPVDLEGGSCLKLRAY